MQKDTVERASALARAGGYGTMVDLERQLRRESFPDAVEHLSGRSIGRQLTGLLRQSGDAAGRRTLHFCSARPNQSQS